MMTQILKEEWEKGARPTYGAPKKKAKKAKKKPDAEEE